MGLVSLREAALVEVSPIQTGASRAVSLWRQQWTGGDISARCLWQGWLCAELTKAAAWAGSGDPPNVCSPEKRWTTTRVVLP